jgi:hypothetical protein
MTLSNLNSCPLSHIFQISHESSYAASILPSLQTTSPIAHIIYTKPCESSYAVSVTHSRQMTSPICASIYTNSHKLSYAASVPHSRQKISPYSYTQPLSTCGPGCAPASDPGHGSGAETSVREPGSGPNLISLIHTSNTSTELCVLPRIQFLARMSRPRIHAPDPTPPRSRARMPTQAGRIFIYIPFSIK